MDLRIRLTTPLSCRLLLFLSNSFFAEHHALRDFEPIARHDAHRAKVMGLERSYNEDEDVKQVMDWQDWSPVEVSQDRWNVLQIDSHSDGLGEHNSNSLRHRSFSHTPGTDTSGARVHELSAPLAAAGISILYQSSYMSDFIFVSPNFLDDPKRSRSALVLSYT